MTTIIDSSVASDIALFVLDETSAVFVEFGPTIRILAEGVPPARVGDILRELGLGRLRDYDVAEIERSRLATLCAASPIDASSQSGRLALVTVLY